METRKHSCSGEEKNLKSHLLSEESSPCVCCRLVVKGAIQGWQPKEDEQKSTKKRVDTSRGGNQGLLRREKTFITAARGDFLFRHYESLDCYIKQYRENHASTCMERDIREYRPVLGVDVPDPYLPKIASSSVLIERIKIIEALSSYYNTERDVKNICLTGKRTDASNETDAFLNVSALKTSGQVLPEIDSKSNNINSNMDNDMDDTNNKNDINNSCNIKIFSLPTVNENEEGTASTEKIQRGNDFTAFTEKLRRNQDIKDIIRVTRNKNNNTRPKTIETFSKLPKKESLTLPAARLVCKETEKPRNETHLKTTFPLIWSDFTETQKLNKKPDRVLETLRIGKKVRTSKENSTEELYDENLNLRSLETREGITSRGTLCLGTTVNRPVTNPKEPKSKKMITKAGIFPCDYTLQHLSKTAKNSPREQTTFIRILGQPKGPLPIACKESNMATTKLERTKSVEKSAKPRQSITRDCGIPLSYLRRLGRRNFHHVLEARSYKPENRKLGTTVIPN